MYDYSLNNLSCMNKTDFSLNGMEIMSFFSVSSGMNVVSRELKGTANSPGEQS